MQLYQTFFQLLICEECQGKAKAEKVQQRGNMELTIRFGKYASLLAEIEKMVEKEVRPPDLQVIYILKTCLNNTKVAKST